MFAFETSVTIERPLQEVFDFVITPSNTPLWQKEVEAFEWTSKPPYGVGSTQRMVTTLVGKSVEAAVKITRWDPPNGYTSKASSDPATIEMTTRLRPQGSGTHLSLSVQVELAGAYRLMERMAARQAEKHVDSSLARLKRLLEIKQASSDAPNVGGVL